MIGAFVDTAQAADAFVVGDAVFYGFHRASLGAFPARRTGAEPLDPYTDSAPPSGEKVSKWILV